MAIPQRYAPPSNITASSRTFFVTSSIGDKRSLLQSSRAADLLIEVLESYRQQGKFRLHEFVIMPDHFHLLLTVDRDLSIERAVQFIKGGFAYRAGKELGFHAPVWQKGFSEVRVWDASTFAKYRAYIWNNPVARGLARVAQEFPFSSAAARVALDTPPQGLKPESLEVSCGMAKAIP